MEDRFHKLRFIAKLKSKTAVEILGVIEGVQSVYVKYGHKIQSVMSDNEAIFRSIETDLGAMGIVSTFTPSGVHNQIVERAIELCKRKWRY